MFSFSLKHLCLLCESIFLYPLRQFPLIRLGHILLRGVAAFGSMTAVYNIKSMGHNFTGIVKISQIKPNQYLEETMKNYHDGTYIVVYSAKNGNFIYNFGWKYNPRKVICFSYTPGMGSYFPGIVYKDWWCDFPPWVRPC